MRFPPRRAGCCVVALTVGFVIASAGSSSAQAPAGERPPTAPDELITELQKRGGLPSTFNTPGANPGFGGDPLAGIGQAPAAQYNFAISTYRERQKQSRRMSNPDNWPVDPVTHKKYKPSPFNTQQLRVPKLNEIWGIGAYHPGSNINMGTGTPEFVYGGVYIPGYGVNNGFGGVYDVQGGTYVPGLGVVGGWDSVSGVPGVLRVNGGLLIPGFGVVPNPTLGLVQTVPEALQLP